MKSQPIDRKTHPQGPGARDPLKTAPGNLQKALCEAFPPHFEELPQQMARPDLDEAHGQAVGDGDRKERDEVPENFHGFPENGS